MVTKNTKVVAARVPLSLFNLVQSAAKKRKITLSTVIIRALKAYYQIK